jgi:hypothetical protein
MHPKLDSHLSCLRVMVKFNTRYPIILRLYTYRLNWYMVGFLTLAQLVHAWWVTHSADHPRRGETENGGRDQV